MAKYIDTDQIVFWIRRVSNSNGLSSDVRKIAFSDEIARIPAADVVEVRRGEWIEGKRIGLNVLQYTCSECGLWADTKFPYCHCGAKMDGKKKEKEIINETLD